MGTLSRGLSSRTKKRQQGDLLAQITELGDPQFSQASDPDSQAQFPAAAAEYQFLQNQQTARNRLDDAYRMGADVTDPQYERLNEAANQGGFLQGALTLGETLVGWIDGPRQFVNLALQDIIGGAAEPGTEDPGFTDYWDAFFGGIEDREEFSGRTGLDPVSGSETLDLMGWELEDEKGWERVFRGVADFGLQVFTDPLTYVTFGLSGLGKKAALGAIRSMQGEAVDAIVEKGVKAGLKGQALADEVLKSTGNKYFASIARQGDDLVTELLEKLAKFEGEIPPSWQEAIGAKLGAADPQLIRDNIWELAVAQKIGKDVMEPAMRRAWGEIPEEILQDLPAYLRGGARVGVPFTKSTLQYGVQIPGTRGLGKQLVGDKMRNLSKRLKEFGPYEKLAASLDDSLTNMDQFRPLLKALGKSKKEGGIEPWQFHIAAGGFDTMHNQAAGEVVTAQLNSKWSNIEGLAEAAGVEDLDEVKHAILNMREQADFANTLLQDMPGMQQVQTVTGPFRSNELNEAVEDLSKYIGELFEDRHAALSKLNPDIKGKYIDGYMPHKPADPMRRFVSRLADEGAAIEERLVMEAQREGNPAKALLAEIIGGQSQIGRLEQYMGGTGYFNQRQVGRLMAFNLTQDGAMMLDEGMMRQFMQDLVKNGVIDPAAADVKYMPISQLNELLGPEVRALADELDIPLPRDWDGKVFNDNPIELVNGYVDSLDEAINSFQMVNDLEAAGLAFRRGTDLSIHDTMQSVMTNLMRRARQVETLTQPTVSAFDEDASNEALRIWSQDDGGQRRKLVREAIDVQGEPDAIDLFGTSGFEESQEQVTELIKRYNAEAAPEPDEMFRVLNRSEIEKFGNAQVGDQIEIDMASASPNDTFAEKTLAEGSHSGFEVRFEEGTKGLKNPHNTGGEGFKEFEVLVSGRFTVKDIVEHESVDGSQTFKQIIVGEQEDILPKLTANPAKQVLDNPDDYAFHAAPRSQVEKIKKEGVRKGGYVDFDKARNYEFNELKKSGEPMVVLAVKKSDLDTAARKQIDETGVFGGRKGSEQLPKGPKPVAEISAQGNFVENLRSVAAGKPQIMETPMLRGFDDATTAATPIEVVGDLRREGLPHAKDTIYQNKELMEMARMSKDDLLAMRPARNIPAQSVNIPAGQSHLLRFGDDGVELHLPAAQNLEDAEAARLDALIELDEAYKRGDIDLSPDGIRTLLANPNTNDSGAELLHEWLGAKMQGLPQRVKEYFGSEAAEVFETRILYNQWEKATNDFMHRYGAVQSKGQLITNPELIKTIGDDQVLNDLKRMHSLARQLGDRGYDEIAAIMSDVDSFTALAKHPGFANAGQFGLSGPAVDAMEIHAMMGKFVRNMAQSSAFMHTPEGITAAKMAASNSLRWWKAMATISRPTFHIRNLVGGSWMNMLMGVGTTEMKNTSQYVRVFREALKKPRAAGADIVEEALNELPENMRPVFRAAWDEDVFSGFVSTEFRKLTSTEKSSRMSWLNVFDVDNFFMTKFGGNAMQSTEDFMRMSLFMKHFDPSNPASSKVARDLVNAIHFDYVNLTPLETQVKSLIPFFVWTRRNLPRQIELAVENPGTVQRYRAMMQAMSDNFGGSEETLPEADWYGAYAAGTNFKVNPNTPFWARVMIDPDLPIKDLLELPWPTAPNLGEYANQLAGPHISTLFDINKQRDFGDVNAPAPFSLVLQSLAAVGLYDETTAGDVRIPYWTRSALETAFPFARELTSVIPGGPNDPNRQQRLGIKEDDDPLSAAIKSALFTGARGVGVQLTTPADARSAAYRSNRELNDIIEDLRLEGHLPPSSR